MPAKSKSMVRVSEIPKGQSSGAHAGMHMHCVDSMQLKQIFLSFIGLGKYFQLCILVETLKYYSHSSSWDTMGARVNETRGTKADETDFSHVPKCVFCPCKHQLVEEKLHGLHTAHAQCNDACWMVTASRVAL